MQDYFQNIGAAWAFHGCHCRQESSVLGNCLQKKWWKTEAVNEQSLWQDEAVLFSEPRSAQLLSVT